MTTPEETCMCGGLGWVFPIVVYPDGYIGGDVSKRIPCPKCEEREDQ